MGSRTVAAGRGSVHVGGVVYAEGDEVPEGVEVGEHVFTAVEEPPSVPSADEDAEKPKAARARKG